MSKAVILQHVAHEGPGRIIPLFRDFGIQTDVPKLYAGDEVPTDLEPGTDEGGRQPRPGPAPQPA